MDFEYIKILMDENLSRQWCSENLIVPLGVEETHIFPAKHVLIAISNLACLATIGDFVCMRFASKHLPVKFVIMSKQELEEILAKIA